MNFRTDLALERHELIGKDDTEGVSSHTENKGNVKITRIEIRTPSAAERLSKPQGNYITVEVPSFSSDGEILDSKLHVLSSEIRKMLPDEGTVLVVGLGNISITPDALGPKAASYILATRHISSELAKSVGLTSLRSVAGISPGVLGQTGIETGEIIRGIVDRIKPSCVVTVDALASRNLSRLGSTVQMSDTGISPGSGVGNARKRLDEETLGVKVISIGVPTVVDGATLAHDLIDREKSADYSVLPESEEMMVTPKEIDLLVERASKLVGLAINCALQKGLSPEEIMSLVS
ncbi:MAG: GPR endopeptidase [Ruminococcaceae bacterium]|nr:GPR endopeptidase [Oscillospiraceae bacterium]